MKDVAKFFVCCSRDWRFKFFFFVFFLTKIKTVSPQSANHNERRLLLSSTAILEASLTNSVDPDHPALLGAV